jgi:hypothetical protein
MLVLGRWCQLELRKPADVRTALTVRSALSGPNLSKQEESTYTATGKVWLAAEPLLLGLQLDVPTGWVVVF